MNSDFWDLKFESNVSRDARNVALLSKQGWRVAIVWECALKRSVEEVAETVGLWLRGNESVLTIE
jgi:DNA mismatch endonuclease (patch repair protein)